MEEVSQKIVNDLQPVFQGFPCENTEKTPVSLDKVAMASAERTRNVFDTLHNTVAKYKKRFTTLADEVCLNKVEGILHVCSMILSSMILSSMILMVVREHFTP